MGEMQRSLGALSSRLLSIDKALSRTKAAILDQEKRVFSLLEKTADRFAPESLDRKQGNALREVVNGIFDDFRNGIMRWREEMRERSEVRQKLEQMGAGLIVVVFGRTNAGKSTLGNFLRGKQLREAPFDNAWKDGTFEPGPITVIERDKSAEETLEGEWLTEGATETTREAQIFRLPGFLWLDTPGFGSTNDNTLGSLARKYVKRADLVIYLDQSDNPGLDDITDQFVTILKEGRCALAAINRSDQKVTRKGPDGKTLWKEQTDANGNVKKVPDKELTAKSPEARSAQQNYLADVIREKLGGRSVEVISISTLLACTAVKTNNDELYAASNMEALFSRILALIADDDSFIALKSRDAEQNCIALINRVIGDDDRNASGERGTPEPEGQKKRVSLKILDDRLGELEERVHSAENDFNIDAETAAITASVMLKARESLNALVEREEEKGESSRKKSGHGGSIVREAGSGTPMPEEKGPEIDINPLMEKYAQEAAVLMEQKAKKLLKDLWLQEALAIRHDFPPMERITLQRKIERHEYEAYTTESYERDPDGFLEHVTSFFGKKHYGTRTRRFKKEQIIDLGYNTQEVFAELAGRMEEELAAHVRDGLEQIKAECLTRGLTMIRQRREILHNTKTKMESLRGELENRHTGNSQ